MYPEHVQPNLDLQLQLAIEACNYVGHPDLQLN